MSRRFTVLFALLICLHAGIAVSAEKTVNSQKRPAERNTPVISASLTPANGGLINNAKPQI